MCFYKPRLAAVKPVTAHSTVSISPYFSILAATYSQCSDSIIYALVNNDSHLIVFVDKRSVAALVRAGARVCLSHFFLHPELIHAAEGVGIFQLEIMP